jgi:endonuclease/exonuclease/phosphatase family metal-dependent hydrolase
VAVCVVVLAGCVNGAAPPEPEPPALSLEVTTVEGPEIPVLGTDTTFDVGTWNLEWFGDASNGPSPEDRQLANVATFMDAAGVDLWGVQEVTSAAQFEALLDRLARYDGLLATDSGVVDGVAYYSGFGGNEMKVGLVYRAGAIRVDSARVILTDHDYAFAGRPPLKVHLTVDDDGASTALAVIVLHAKAGADPDDRDRRADGSTALLAYLDARYPDAPVLVIGDFNDDVDTSIADGYPSPYANFVDSAGYAFPTAALSAAGETSMVFYPDVIDHQLGTDELTAYYVDGSAAVVPADRWFDAYAESTSDHYPVTARYTVPGGAIASGPAGVRVELRWAGAGSAAVDIYRDGALRVRTENDGAYVDTVAEDATVTYRVCEAATAVCSGDVVYP